MREFAGHVVAITGACGGIGAAIARSFASAGASLALCDLKVDALATLAEELRAGGNTVHEVAVDVVDEEQVRRFCETTGHELGRIDVLVNTVGVIDNLGDVEHLTTAQWNRSLAINLTSAFLTAKYCAPMLKVRGGVIVNVSSVSGLANQEDAMVYSVTKAALLSLTRSEAIDLARFGVRAVAICPGSVATPLIELHIELTAARLGTSPADQRREWEAQYPSGRFSTPQEVADLTLFLSGPRAANITGTSIVIDGGLTALLAER